MTAENRSHVQTRGLLVLATVLTTTLAWACTSSRGPSPSPAVIAAPVEPAASEGPDAAAPTQDATADIALGESAEQPSDAEPGEADGQTGQIAPDETPPELTEVDGDVAEEEALATDELLEQALDACESAGQFWREGSFEDALAALDRAYELMLHMSSNGDPVMAQQKEDLRHLISRRIVEIYASQRTTVGDMAQAIPLVMNSHVEREIVSFQTVERDYFMESYKRSGLYRPMILEVLREAGMPEQLSWLPLIESGFKVRALSRARALGLWQFISSTGYRFGLRRDSWLDERMDPEKSTRAAVAYLTEIHSVFGDWLTTIAGYNCGEHTVLKTINRQHVNYLDQFWDLYEQLPRETARYVPRFLATLHIVSDPERFGFVLPEPDPPWSYEEVRVERPVELARVDVSLGLASGATKDLNPELRQGATPPEGYQLRVPQELGATLLAQLDSLPAWSPPAPQYGVHRVRQGETLSHIASRYGTSVSALRDLNRLRNPNRLSVGQHIKVPQRGGGGGAMAAAPASPPPEPAGSAIQYTVRHGDNLWRLAGRYGTTVGAIQRANGLSSTQLSIGQRLEITVGGGASSAPASFSPSSSSAYVVRRGDTPASIARDHRVSLDELLRVNGLDRRSVIYPGQRLLIPD